MANHIRLVAQADQSAAKDGRDPRMGMPLDMRKEVWPRCEIVAAFAEISIGIAHEFKHSGDFFSAVRASIDLYAE